MSQTTSPTQIPEIETLRCRTLDVLDRVVKDAAEFELPRPPDALPMCRDKLRDNRYTILVAGEAKRGKSTFINALLGRPLLPTDVDIATCQVFCIRQSEQEGYRVRFEDGSTQEITAADLARYGSQVLANAGACPGLDQIIRWIEVEGPLHFLPKEIALLDTPGLGSLYREHGRITQRFVPLADAVVFVLNSDSPISREEIEFVDKILGVTRSVFFIQTMIDRYQREHWQTIQGRNEQLLAEKFGDRLLDKRVWPIASTNLLKAAQTGDLDYEQVSKFRPLATFLHRFLFRVAGWSRAAEALLVAHAFHQCAAGILAARLAGLEGAADTNRTQVQQLAEQRKQFAEEWGEEGRKREELVGNLREAAVESKQEIWHALRPGCKIEVEKREEIDALGTLDQARHLAGRLSSHLLEAATERWRKVVVRFQARCIDLLQPLLQATDLTKGPSQETDLDLTVCSGRGLDLSDDPYLRVTVATDEFVRGTVVAAGAGWVLSLVVATSWFPPVAIAGAFAAGIWGAMRGFRLIGGEQVQAAREALHQHLDAVLQQIRNYFFGREVDAASRSVVDHFLDSQLRVVADRTAAHASQKLEEAQAETVRLTAEASLDEERRQQKARQLSQELDGWAQVGVEIRVLTQQLNQLERWHNTPASIGNGIP